MIVKEKEILIKKWKNFERDKIKLNNLASSIVDLSAKHYLAMLRREINEAEKILYEMKENFLKLRKISKRDDYFKKIKIMEEAEISFIACILLQNFLVKKELPSIIELQNEFRINTSSYINALLKVIEDLDLIFLEYLSKGEKDKAENLKKNLLKLYFDLLSIDMKSEDIRTKLSNIRKILKKMEEEWIIYNTKCS